MNKGQVYQKKVFDLKALDVDTATRSVKVAIAELESIDRDNDVFDAKAFDRTIKNKGPHGSNEVWHLLDHTATSFSALSKFTELYREGKYIVGVSKYKDSFAWREVAWPLYESGDVTQHSVGFRTVTDTDGKGHRAITDVELWEASMVLWGANPNTPTMGVTKSATLEERTADLHSRMERLLKFITASNDFEETKGLVEIEVRQIQQQISDIEKTTQRSEKQLDPVNEQIATIQLFINTLNK